MRENLIMVRGAIILLFCMGIFSHNYGQSMKKLQEVHQQILLDAPDEDKRSLLNAFVDAMENFAPEKLLAHVDKDHYNRQMEMYRTDDFMFNHLGEPGNRDERIVQTYYFRESLSMSQMDAEKYISGKAKSFFKLENLDEISKVYFEEYKEEALGVGLDRVIFRVITKKKKHYIGRIYIIRDLSQITAPSG